MRPGRRGPARMHACQWCVFEAFPRATEDLGQIFRASIINTSGPSFRTFGHLNISKVVDGCWNLICVVSRRKLGAQTSPMMLMTLALGGCWAPSTQRSKYTLWAVFVVVNSVGGTCSA